VKKQRHNYTLSEELELSKIVQDHHDIFLKIDSSEGSTRQGYDRWNLFVGWAAEKGLELSSSQLEDWFITRRNEVRAHFKERQAIENGTGNTSWWKSQEEKMRWDSWVRAFHDPMLEERLSGSAPSTPLSGSIETPTTAESKNTPRRSHHRTASASTPSTPANKERQEIFSLARNIFEKMETESEKSSQTVLEFSKEMISFCTELKQPQWNMALGELAGNMFCRLSEFSVTTAQVEDFCRAKGFQGLIETELVQLVTAVAAEAQRCKPLVSPSPLEKRISGKTRVKASTSSTTTTSPTVVPASPSTTTAGASNEDRSLSCPSDLSFRSPTDVPPSSNSSESLSTVQASTESDQEPAAKRRRVLSKTYIASGLTDDEFGTKPGHWKCKECDMDGILVTSKWKHIRRFHPHKLVEKRSLSPSDIIGKAPSSSSSSSISLSEMVPSPTFSDDGFESFSSPLSSLMGHTSMVPHEPPPFSSLSASSPFASSPFGVDFEPSYASFFGLGGMSMFNEPPIDFRSSLDDILPL